MGAALEALVARELVPDDWLEPDVSRRAFARASLCGRCKGGFIIDGQRDWRGGAVRTRCLDCPESLDSCVGQPMPESLDELIALALDPRAIQTAEVLGLEVLSKIPDIEPARARVLWRFVDFEHGTAETLFQFRAEFPYIRSDELGALQRFVLEPIDRERVASGRSSLRAHIRAALSGAIEREVMHVEAALVWRAARSRDALDREQGGDSLVSVLFDTLDACARDEIKRALLRYGREQEALCTAVREGPFEAAAELWRLGIGIQAVTERTIVLVVPVVRD